MPGQPSSDREERRRAERRGRVRRRRITALGGLATVTAVVAVLLNSGGGSKGPSPGQVSSPTASSSTAAAGPPRLLARRSSQRLPAAVSGEALAAQGSRLLVIGGLDSGGASTDHVWSLDGAGGPVRPAGSLSAPLHDAAATALGGQVVVFGGGSSSTLDTVQQLVPGGPAQVIGHLPVAVSDLSALSVGSSAYAIGGYDNSAPVGTVLQSADGRRFTKFAQLPGTARYAASAVVGQKIYLFGGELADGSDSDRIQEVDLAARSASVVGRLDRPLSHSSAVTLGGRIYVLGGRTNGVATDRILSFDPASGRVSPAGRLPAPVTNAAAGSIGSAGYLVGGLDSGGAPLDAVVIVRLAS